MTDEPLAGLEGLRSDMTPMELAAKQQLDQLRAEGRLTDQHVIVEQLILALARGVGESAARGRAAGVALAARELREAIALLPQSVNDEFADLAAQLTAANAEARANAAKGRRK